ncbi:MAG: M28 family peptidase [Planctomycetota bacterium]
MALRPPPRAVASAVAALALLAVVLAGAPASATPPPPAEHDPEITKAELSAWVKALADDAMEGRESGEPGCDAASEWLAAEFGRLGLRPAGDGGTFFQQFTIPRGVKVLPATTLTVTGKGGKPVAFRLAEEFAPADVSGPGDVTADAVFAGYGIRAPEHGYDDYADLDAKGRVVVVLRRAPAWEDKKSPFATPQALEKFASFQAKADAAAAAGAVALVIVNDPASSTTKEKDDLKPAGGGQAGKLPVVQVVWKGAGARLSDALGLPLAKRQAQLDGKLMPKSEALDGVTVRVHCALEPEVRKVRNVAALLVPERTVTADAAGAAGPAAGEPKETVVVGAHYDHVGRGRFGSLAGAAADGKIHNGADDNASGTAAMLEVAGWLTARRAELSRRVLFLGFSGEELGLLGSKKYVEAPLVPLADTVAMLNLDMVGRLDERLYVGGTGTSPLWPDALERLNKAGPRLTLKLWPGGKAPSDHESFYGKDVPVLFFFTGLHGDYHRPSDDWNTLNYDGHAKVARLAAAVALEVATCPTRPAFTKCDAGGFEVGPWLGLSVDPKPDGLVVSHVDDKSPAKKAGVKEGDRLLEWSGAPLKDANAFNEFLSKSKPGDKLELTIERKGKKQKLTVTMGST